VHHVLSALLVEDAPHRLAVDRLHRRHDRAVVEHARGESIAGVERRFYGLAGAEDHRGWIDEGDRHAVCTHRIHTIGAHLGVLDFLLQPGRLDGVKVELTLGDADDPRSLHIARPERGKCQCIDVVVFIQAGTLERIFQLLDIRRQDAVLQVHGRSGVLHGAVIDGDQLL